VIADETIGVFRKNTSLGSIDVVIVTVLGGGGGGERERGRRQAAIGRIAPKKVTISKHFDISTSLRVLIKTARPRGYLDMVLS